MHLPIEHFARIDILIMLIFLINEFNIFSIYFNLIDIFFHSILEFSRETKPIYTCTYIQVYRKTFIVRY